MLQLQGNCRAGKFSVYPSNWKQPGANKNLYWRISYWFFDDNLEKRKKIVIKGMNHLTTVEDKRDAVTALLENEKELITDKRWNHITQSFGHQAYTGDNTDYIIDPSTPFILALKESIKNMEAEPDTLRDTRHVVKHVEIAAKELKCNTKPVAEVRRRDLIAILKQCAKNRPGWSNNSFNSYRKNLGMCFKKLVELEAVEFNPVKDILKKPTTKKIRQVLTLQERKLVNDHLKQKYYRFWLFLQIFFHSGARIKELMRIQGKDVDLLGQRFKCLIKKKKQTTEVKKAIKDIALEYWIEAMAGCGENDYLFSEGLKPGVRMIRADQISHRWYNHVKASKSNGGLGITADFYCLKHMNLDETAAALSLNDASAAADHTTPVITLRNYAYGEHERQQERISKVNNEF